MPAILMATSRAASRFSTAGQVALEKSPDVRILYASDESAQDPLAGGRGTPLSFRARAACSSNSAGGKMQMHEMYSASASKTYSSLKRSLVERRLRCSDYPQPFLQRRAS
jgi:hypothetical protein